jgi:hypothetical protein
MFAFCEDATSSASWRLPRQAKCAVDTVDTAHHGFGFYNAEGGSRKAPVGRRGGVAQWLHKARACIPRPENTLLLYYSLILRAVDAWRKVARPLLSGLLVRFKKGCFGYAPASP